MPNVLHVSVRSDYGGGPKHIETLLRLLGRRYTFFCAAPTSGAHFNTFNDLSAECFPLPYRAFSLLALLRLIRFVRQKQIRLLHSHGRGAGVYSRIVGLLTGVPVIHAHHGFYYHKLSGIKKWPLIALERIFIRLSKRVIFVSPSEIAASQEARLYDLKKSVLIPNGVAFVPLSTLHRQNVARGYVEIVCVTRLAQEKGNRFLLDVIAHLALHDVPHHVTVVGDGPEKSILERVVEERKLGDRVRFLGARSDVAEILANADIFCSCSLGEGHSIALLEAMAHGLPIVASRVIGHVDMIRDGFNGYLFDLSNPEAGANALLRLIMDPQLRSDMGARGRTWVETEYSETHMADLIDKLYQSVIQEVAKMKKAQ